MLYILGLLLATLIGMTIKAIFSHFILKGSGEVNNDPWYLRPDLIIKDLKVVIDTKRACNIMEPIFADKISLFSLYTLFYGFTLVYFYTDKLMRYKNTTTEEDIVAEEENKKDTNLFDGTAMFSFLFLIIMFFIHSFIQVDRGCAYVHELGFGLLLGVVLGVLWKIIIKTNDWVQTTKRCDLYGSTFFCEDLTKPKTTWFQPGTGNPLIFSLILLIPMGMYVIYNMFFKKESLFVPLYGSVFVVINTLIILITAGVLTS